MDEQKFWKIIEESLQGAHGSQAVQKAKLKKILSTLDAGEIAAFDQIFTRLMHKSYTWDLWGGAYVLNGGCSDDSFEYFRRGLIASGREKFERSLKDPEYLADWAEPDELEFEDIEQVVYDVYKEKTGSDKHPEHGLKHPKTPSGEKWREDGDDLETRFPHLWAKFGE